MESLAQLEALCERLYNSKNSAERAHAENTLKCFSTNADYISQCQYILDNASTPYALMLASSSLLKQVTEQRLPLQLRLDIRNILACLQIIMARTVIWRTIYDWLWSSDKALFLFLLSLFLSLLYWITDNLINDFSIILCTTTYVLVSVFTVSTLLVRTYFSYFHLEYMVYKMVFLFVHIIQAMRNCSNHEHFLFFALPYLIGDIFVLFV